MDDEEILAKQYSLISQLNSKIQSIDEKIKELESIKDKAITILENKKEKFTEQEISNKINKLRAAFNNATDKMNEKKKSLKKNLQSIEDLDRQIRDLTKRILEEKGVTLDDPNDARIKTLENQKAKLLEEKEKLIHELSLNADQADEDYKQLLIEMKEIADHQVTEDLVEESELLLEEQQIIMEELQGILKLRGLTIIPPNSLKTLSGRILTIEEAMTLHLLEGIDLEELMKLFDTRFQELTEEKSKEKSKEKAEEKIREKFEEICEIKSHPSFKSESKSSLSSESSQSSRESVITGMTSEDVHYLKEFLGKPLIMALAEINAKRPRDPIHYLGQWLLKYRLNEETDIIQKQEIETLLAERERLLKDKLTKMFEEEARDMILEAIIKAEEKAIQNQIEAELRRIAEEAMAAEEEGDFIDEAGDILGVYGGPPANQYL